MYFKKKQQLIFFCLFCSDLAETFETQLKNFFVQDWVNQLLRDARTSRHYGPSTKDTSRWAKEMIKRACQ